VHLVGNCIIEITSNEHLPKKQYFRHDYADDDQIISTTKGAELLLEKIVSNECKYRSAN
jgi:hypothetical protein